MENIRFRCNNEILEYSKDNGLTWRFVVGMDESLHQTAENIVSVFGNFTIEDRPNIKEYEEIYVRFDVECDFVGCSNTFYEYYDEISEEELDTITYQYARENAEDYTHMVHGENREEFLNDAYGKWCIVSKEEFEKNR